VTLRMPKKISILFSYNLTTGVLYEVLKCNFLPNFYVKILFCNHYFTKNKEPEPDPEPDPDPDAHL
jgi:hypothetical protein